MATSNKQQVIAKIRFLEDQLTSLDHYLPETYEYLMAELDTQKRQLAEMEVQAIFKQIDSDRSNAPPGSSRASKNHGHPFSRTENRNKKRQGT